MHPVVEGHWPVSSLRCETVVTCVCVVLVHTVHCCPHMTVFLNSPLEMQKALWVRYASVGLLIKDQDYSYCISRPPPVKVRSSQCCVDVAVLAPGILPSSVLFPAGWTLSSPCHPAPYLSLMSVVPWVRNGIFLGLSIFIPLMTGEFTHLCTQHRPIPFVKCLYHLSIRLLGFLTDFLVSFFLL